VLTLSFLGRSLIDKLKHAAPERRAQAKIFADLESVIDPKSIAEWTKDIQAWERDCTQPNPFKARVKGEDYPSIVWL
jgi:hypothetical protein